MAVSSVKERLMLFQAAENNNVPDRKPSKGEPPALQKFRQNQQQAQVGSEGDSRPPVALKPGQNNLRKNSKTDTDSTDSGPGGGSGAGRGKVNVAKLFQEGNAPPAIRPVVPLKKPGAAPGMASNSETSSKTTSPEGERPKVALKPPNKPWSPTSPTSAAGNKTVPSPGLQTGSDGNKHEPPGKPSPSAPKSSIITNGDGTAVNKSSEPIKLPSMNGIPSLKKVESPVSSSSSANSKSSTSSSASGNTNGPIDFRSHLKKSRPSLGGKVESASDGEIKEVNNATPNSTTDLLHSEPLEKPDPLKRLNRSDASSTNEPIERPSDHKRFKKVELSSLPAATSKAPQKPDLPEGGVDLTLICQQHARLLQSLSEDDLPPPPPPDDVLEEDDIYDDGTSNDVVTRQLSQKSQQNRKSSRVVSEIPEMTAEEEGEIYDDGQTEESADLLYGDATSSDTKPTLADDDDDDASIYADEIEEEPEESEEAKKKRLKEEAEAKKREEKRRKEEEKKKKNEEKEEQKRRKRFNLTGNETNVGEGTIKEDAKGRGNSLAVKKGQIVTIVRLDNNPANKILVKTDLGMGYVENSNIEIDADIIRQAMLLGRQQSTSNSNPASEGDDGQLLYDDVAEEDEIYQCVD